MMPFLLETLFVNVANRHVIIKNLGMKLGMKLAIKPWITKEYKEIMAERD